MLRLMAYNRESRARALLERNGHGPGLFDGGIR